METVKGFKQALPITSQKNLFLISESVLIAFSTFAWWWDELRSLALAHLKTALRTNSSETCTHISMVRHANSNSPCANNSIFKDLWLYLVILAKGCLHSGGNQIIHFLQFSFLFSTHIKQTARRLQGTIC